MNYSTLIQLQVKELLGLHNCVTIPGLGSFIYRENQASANFFTHEVKVAGRTVFFNNSIVADDGLLVQQLREIAGLTYTDALKLTENFKNELIEQLDSKRTVSFGDLGNFFVNQDKHIFFLPSSGLNLDKSSYGLPVLKLTPVVSQEQTQTAKSHAIPSENKDKNDQPTISKLKIEDSEEATVISVDIDESHSKGKSHWWKIAAGIAILSLSVTGVYYAKNWFIGKQNIQKAGVEINPDSLSGSTENQHSVDINPLPIGDTQAISGSNPIVNQLPEVTSETENIVSPPIEEKLVETQSKTGKYWVIASMSITEELANIHSQQWQSTGINTVVLKPENSSLYRVVLGRFGNQKDAEAFLNTITVLPGFNPFIKNIK